MKDEIPYADLGISLKLQTRLESNPPHQVRLAFASGRMCETDNERLGLCVLLSADEDDLVAKTAKRFLERWSSERIKDAITRKTHPKVLEFVIEFLPQDDILDEHIFMCITLNARSAKLIASRASVRVCEEISKNKQQLLLNPELLLVLQSNPNCAEACLFRTETFLRMQNALPAGYDPEAPASPAPPAPPKKAPVSAMDLEAEIMAALSGSQSPSFLKAQESFDMFDLEDDPNDGNGFDLGGFSFDFNEDSDDFSWDLTEDSGSKSDDDEEEDVRVSMEQKIAQLNVGHKIKLAYKGNKEARSILIRDTNKSVAVAVVKSGRLTDGEVAGYAGNRNLADDVIREISNNNEFVRKYPVKVALVNNPKCPPSVAMGFVGMLHKKDLQNLARNRNVSSVVKTAALKRFKEKYRKE